ncbi:hypothetical protein [Secundilactobacillus malefermentans]|uniref:hypothetical protein n=1 Tax=Secundilactobacillus malefermentans TaxID=176292 RepID=UPI0012DD4FD6|nr:hypothetical protein [Secundilactobacillus malefermentans]
MIYFWSEFGHKLENMVDLVCDQKLKFTIVKLVGAQRVRGRDLDQNFFRLVPVKQS